MTVHVLGIDPSTAATGLAFPEGDFRTISPKSGPENVAQRLSEIDQAFRDSIRRRDIDVAMIEDVLMMGNFQAERKKQLGFVGGVLRLALFEHAIPFVEVNPMSLKKYATGNGASQKHDMTRTARNLGLKVANDNEADAALLKRIGDDFYNLPPGWPSLEKHQLDLLGKLTFPKGFS